MTLATNVIEAEAKFDQETRLINAARGGDKQAFQTLYQKYIGMVYSLCFRLMGDGPLAEDASQEVFIQLWKKLENYRGDSKFSTWLHSVTANIAISYLRKQRGWLQRMFHIEDTDAINTEAEGSAGDVDLDEYVKRLPERARIVFVLHAIEGYRHEEIASMTNMAVGSSKAQYHRAKQLLKEWMGYE
ncbi:RNA polymerase sigma factor [Neptunicella marina]|uniref:RNA polymerase sigma factor n=1 Tax=Neptunicella marina TaxID=2125989 RepID=A0A8J6IWV7_9ALTE|nr:RNA polymerase sigma factor [Neptunicella marina]MBC3766843.1 RNA polymerase sigma factor [Neptunicella marina]